MFVNRRGVQKYDFLNILFIINCSEVNVIGPHYHICGTKMRL